MPEWWNRSRVLLSMKQEFERQTTEKQIAENEGHEQFQESQRIAPGKVQGGTGAANDADFKERNNYIVLVTILITTVTFAAAFQVPGGYDDKGKPILLNNQQFKYFLICDSLAFGTSTASLFIYFGMPLLQRLTPAVRGARSLSTRIHPVISPLPPNDSFPATLPQPVCSGRQFVL
nr:ankyrin repeat-containing protein itn1 [Quercus suber]